MADRPGVTDEAQWLADLRAGVDEAMRQWNDALRDSLRGMAFERQPTQRSVDALRGHFQRMLDEQNPERVPPTQFWPKAPGIVSAECREHGECEPLSVDGSIWCPQCLVDPHFVVDGGSIVGPSLTVKLEQPVSYITVQADRWRVPTHPRAGAGQANSAAHSTPAAAAVDGGRMKCTCGRKDGTHLLSSNHTHELPCPVAMHHIDPGRYRQDPEFPGLGYLNLVEPREPGDVARTVQLRDLLEYKGPPVGLDLDAEGRILGIEVVG